MTTQNRPRKPRIPLSCEPCRSRKLKCNREKPCQNCIVRNKSTQCIFKAYEDGAPATQKVRVDDMQDRINRLESLVTSLVAQNIDAVQTNDIGGFNRPITSQPSTHVSSEDVKSEDLKNGAGVISLDGNRSVYRGSTHWGDVLEELHELKSVWGHFQGSNDIGGLAFPALGPIDGPSILGGGIIRPVSREELLATLPSKQAVDKLLDRFFDEEDSPVPTFHILHRPSFEKEYEEYWKNPAATPVMWLGMLFSIISLTMVSYTLTCDEPPEYEGISASLAELYRLRTAQCLVLGDVTKCEPHTLETLIYNTMTEWALNKEGVKRVWMMCGIMIRVGIQMGYHRDPSHYPELSILQGERRRRVWAFIHRTDSLTSFLVGLPSMVRALDTDSATPRNLFDADLSEELTELPPSRPDTEVTPVSYLRAKDAMLNILGKIVDFLNSLGPSSYERVLEIDKEFSEAYANLPPYFKTEDMESLRTLSSSLANRRVQLIFLHHQGTCVLHRKFLAQGRTDPRFALSYKRCIDSAMVLLQLQNFLYTDAQIKGDKVARHWYRVSYMTQEFILSAMILCIDLKHRKRHNSTNALAQDNDILRLLRTACDIWKFSRNTSPEAVKVYDVLSYMLGTLEDNTVQLPGDRDTIARTETNFEGLALENTSQGDISNLEMDFDWGVWDTFIEGASFEESYGSYPVEILDAGS